ncbi:related to monooxygenase [Serendipita indica DSM 11827]|uniref:Related to monooxygenase n=1 Tax=Serendipita indica (strain DSM 11827) TaxID=1109443 RepID=G4TZS5_SERID|nr:related to monooxygenase [Serendipita indica DSM 11827]
MLGLPSFVSTGLVVAQALLAARSVQADNDSLYYNGPRVPFVDYPGMAAASAQAIGEPLPYDQHVPECKAVKKRVEWRTLTYDQKKDYMRAIKCLQNKPDYGISPQYPTLYDAFVWVHTTNWTDFHLNAWFMPWHRWFVWIHSEAMEKVCDYSGPVPYWNYTADYQNFLESPIFSSDPDIGFGSHGNTAVNVSGLIGFKVDNGAFANMKSLAHDA